MTTRTPLLLASFARALNSTVKCSNQASVAISSNSLVNATVRQAASQHHRALSTTTTRLAYKKTVEQARAQNRMGVRFHNLAVCREKKERRENGRRKEKKKKKNHITGPKESNSS